MSNTNLVDVHLRLRPADHQLFTDRALADHRSLSNWLLQAGHELAAAQARPLASAPWSEHRFGGAMSNTNDGSPKKVLAVFDGMMRHAGNEAVGEPLEAQTGDLAEGTQS